jgi:hypothetical protein
LEPIPRAQHTCCTPAVLERQVCNQNLHLRDPGVHAFSTSWLLIAESFCFRVLRIEQFLIARPAYEALSAVQAGPDFDDAND